LSSSAAALLPSAACTRFIGTSKVEPSAAIIAARTAQLTETALFLFTTDDPPQNVYRSVITA
jgi:hypothetical protein